MSPGVSEGSRRTRGGVVGHFSVIEVVGAMVGQPASNLVTIDTVHVEIAHFSKVCAYLWTGISLTS